MDTFLEDGFGFVELELSLEIVEMVGIAATVGPTTGVGEVELLIDYFLTDTTPIALAAAILLRLLGVDTLEAMLGKELGNSLLREDGALGKTSMVFVVELMRTSHDG